VCLRAPEPVVEVGRLESEQVDTGCDVEHAVERAPADELAQHPAVLGLDGAREVECDGERDERDELAAEGRAPCPASRRGA
jgi:hypothetical protein